MADEVRQRLRETAVAGGGDTGTVGWALEAAGRKEQGKQVVDLTWNKDAASGDTSVIVYRDGDVVVEAAANVGSYTDNIGVKGGGTYTYHLCGSNDNCSQTVTVTF
ncbi:MAG TPA: hypothetical protein VGW11_12590 [Solirubrobacteraceae bacterium]|nr:hypothetical protein [Solirubrobacteraceae bacterium]